MAEEWIDTVDENGDDIRVLSPAEPDMIVMVMDESDWNFVIDCLRFRARKSMGDTVERANFTADTMQDVLDGAR